MNAADLVSMSWTNLTRRKGRTTLTAAGVVVGVAALVLMVSLGLGLRREVLKAFETEDELQSLQVTRASDESGKGRGGAPGFFGLIGAQMLPITEKDLTDIRAVPGVRKAEPSLDVFITAKIEKGEWTRNLGAAPVGAVPSGEESRYRDALVAGTLWSPSGDRECLIPKQVLDFRLHVKPEEMVGAKVTLGGKTGEGEADPEKFAYTCVGVFDADKIGFRGGRKFVLTENRMRELREAVRGGILYPIPFKKDTYPLVTVRLADSGQGDAVSARLKNMGFDVLSAADVIRSINLVFLIVEAVMSAIGAIGLVVSLFGIANTMAMAVLERTREIGIMKALGARNRDVGRLFLVEAAAIGALGGGIGLGLAWLAGKMLNLTARATLNLPAEVSLFHVSLWLAAGSVLFSMFVSVLAGTVPARRAARMDPVRSLRYE